MISLVKNLNFVSRQTFGNTSRESGENSLEIFEV
jgi:hypothetical protein